MIPYPLRAAKITIDIMPFGIWWKPLWWSNNKATEWAKEQGAIIWYARWLWFQISYSRWL